MAGLTSNKCPYREPADCNNGAAQYLLYGGIALLVLNVVTLVGGCARQLAMKV